MSYLLAIDPGSNKCGLALFQDQKLSYTITLTSNAKTPLKRRINIATALSAYLQTSDVVSEEPLLLGRNNNGMQRLLGMIEYLKPEVQFVHPMTVKKFMGHGSKDKLEVALACGEMLTTEAEREILANAITREAWDETDAIAVGLSFLKKQVN